ncbi:MULTISPECIES: hypothetical protein [Ochrobactrum]|uniref:hypothetical protein n=1 Tax=Ochrobactrum TaxID=528 RepID=UPI001784D46F|nr:MULTISPECIES: hypothetical protein [Brucella/Ochrobactrum group]MBD7993023.1 hypothetical protein [Ochrobactrum gallinarum]MDH7793609.1 hypothetical protein [Ochrobactrum sp. AN78]
MFLVAFVSNVIGSRTSHSPHTAFSDKNFVNLGWGPPASTLFHLALAVLVFCRLPPNRAPQPDHSIDIELVEPPVHKPGKPKPEDAPKSQLQVFESAGQDVREMEPTQSPPTPIQAIDNEANPTKADNIHRRDPRDWIC